MTTHQKTILRLVEAATACVQFPLGRPENRALADALAAYRAAEEKIMRALELGEHMTKNYGKYKEMIKEEGFEVRE